MKDQLFKDVSSITRSADELQDNYTTRDIVIRVWREHLRPRIGVLAIAVIGMLLTAGTTGAIPFLIQRTADDVFVAKNADMVYWITGAIVIVTVIKAIAEYVSDVTVAYLGHRFVADLRIQMFERLANADLGWIQTVHSGRLLSGFLNDANLIRATASRSLITLGENSLKIVILVATMFYMDPRFSLLILNFMPVALVMLSRQRRKMRKSTTNRCRKPGTSGAHHPNLARDGHLAPYWQEEPERNPPPHNYRAFKLHAGTGPGPFNPSMDCWRPGFPLSNFSPAPRGSGNPARPFMVFREGPFI